MHIPSRASLEALPPDAFGELYRTMVSIAMFRIPRTAAFRPGSAAAKLAALDVGESVLFPHWNGCHRLGQGVKRYARIRLQDPKADWKGKTTTKGVRVTRTR